MRLLLWSGYCEDDPCCVRPGSADGQGLAETPGTLQLLSSSPTYGRLIKIGLSGYQIPIIDGTNMYILSTVL